MPTYDYDCPSCGGFDAFRSLAERNEPAGCPDCGTASPRVFVSAPRLACLSGDTRTAMGDTQTTARGLFIHAMGLRQKAGSDLETTVRLLADDTANAAQKAQQTINAAIPSLSPARQSPM